MDVLFHVHVILNLIRNALTVWLIRRATRGDFSVSSWRGLPVTVYQLDAPAAIRISGYDVRGEYVTRVVVSVLSLQPERQRVSDGDRLRGPSLEQYHQPHARAERILGR